MKKFLLFLLPLSFILASCDSADPVKYNDQVVDHFESATKSVNALYSEAEKAFETNDFSNLKDQTKAAVDSLEIDIQNINKLSRPSGSEEFHNASIACIESLVSYVNAIGNEYSRVTDDTTEEELEKMDKVIEDTQKVYEQKVNSMIEAQKSFAKAKNFDLKNTKY